MKKAVKKEVVPNKKEVVTKKEKPKSTFVPVNSATVDISDALEAKKAVEECSTCRFYREVSRMSKGVDVCRRFPPITPGMARGFPAVKSDDWCGEWKKK